MITINVAQDYTKTPGGRHIVDGDYSGEDFREKVLKPAFIRAKQENDALEINLDGGYGYGSSFLDEAFGGLAREMKDPEIRNIKVVSDEEPELVARIARYIEKGLIR